MARRSWTSRIAARGRPSGSSALAGASLAVVLLAGCGTPSGAASAAATTPTALASATADAAALVAGTATAQAFGTRNAQRVAAMLTPTPATPTPGPAPTSTPTPAATATPRPLPTPSVAATAVPTPYVADFAAWPTATPTSATPARVSYDAATKAYTIAITDPTWDQVYIQYVPQAISFGDFVLSLEVRQTAGPPNTNVGVVFGAQAKGLQDKTSARYNILVIPEAQRAGATYTSAGDQRTLLGVDAAPMLKKNGANQLQVTRESHRITVSINGQHFADYTGTTDVPGAIGLVVANPAGNSGPASAAAMFSSLKVTPLSSR